MTALRRRLPVRALKGGWETAEVRAHPTNVNVLALSPDGKRILAGSTNPTTGPVSFYRYSYCSIKLWDADRMEVIKEIKFEELVNLPAMTVLFPPGGGHALLAAASSPVYRLNLYTGEIVKTPIPKVETVFLAVSPDGEFLFNSVSKRKCIVMYEIRTGRSIRVFNMDSRHFSHISLTPDGRFLIVHGNYSERVRVFDVASGSRVEIEIADSNVDKFNRAVLYGGAVSFLCWDWKKNNQDNRPVQQIGRILGMTLTANERFALLFTEKSEFQIWDIDKRAHVRSFAGRESPLAGLAVSRDGRFVYSAETKGLLKKWELDWELKYMKPADWDEGAEPHLSTFLALRTPRSGVLPPAKPPTGEQAAAYLTRRGKPSWTRNNFKALMKELGWAGFGRLRPEGIRSKL